MRRAGLGVWIAVLAAGPLAFAATKPKVPERTLPTPDVKLEITPGASGKPWQITVTNAGTTPLRLVADTRLVRLTIAPQASATPPPPKGKKAPKGPVTVDCVLPGSMRRDERKLVLPPGTKWVETFDPRLHCLDLAKKLVPGATVTAQLGWALPKGKKPAAPFVVEPAPSAGASAEVAAAKEIVGAPLTLDVPTSASAASTLPMTPPSASASVFARPGPARSFGDGGDAETTIIVVNPTKQTKRIYARPQLVDARVTSPRGVQTSCSGMNMFPAPIIDFMTTLAANGTWQATVALKSICPAGTFDVPGLYFVTPVLHAPPINSFAPKGESVSGDFATIEPQLVRIETGPAPFHASPAKTSAP